MIANMDMQLDLLAQSVPQPTHQEISNVPGLLYLPDFLTAEQEATLLQQIDGEEWITDLKRRVQHYGYRYDYQSRGLDDSLALGALPNWLQVLAQTLAVPYFNGNLPDQVIANEYLPGQGISAHIDRQDCFGDTVVSLSLGSTCIMDFIQPAEKRKQSFLLELRCLLVVQQDARYLWQHAIAPRKKDSWNQQLLHRGRRVSLTFRTVRH
jgi:alkylated DNA repair dioxygenase AlkB